MGIKSEYDTFNFNEPLIMMENGHFITPDFNLAQCKMLFEKVTGDSEVAPQIHPTNIKDEMIFDELVEFLVRLGVRTAAIEGRQNAKLLEKVEGMLAKVYDVTKRIY